MPTTLITGVAGFIGSHLAEALVEQGTSVVGIDNFDPYYDETLKRRNLADVEAAAARTGGGFAFSQLDLLDGPALQRVMQQHKPQTVIHLAASAGVRPSIASPVRWVSNNAVGTQVLLSACQEAAVERIICASSSSVYGNCRTTPFHEQLDVSEPISPYAASKRACELLAFTHHHLHKQPVAMLRFFTVFGPRQRPDLAISLFMRKVHAGTPIEVFGPLETARDYTYVADTVAGILSAAANIDRFGYRIWNLGHDHPVTLGEMISAIGKTVGREPITNCQPQRPGDVDRTWADLQRAKAELGYNPTTSFEQGLTKQWQWLRQGL